MCRAMAVSGHLLILLVPVLSLCVATEYYVRPTEPSNISCPAQPCLTLSQYNNESDHYFKSNTVFKFLPGTHHMDRPLTIGDVHNMSLRGLQDESDEYPHLVAQFSCKTKVHECIHLHFHWFRVDFKVCCAVVWLYDMYNVTVKGIHIAVQMLNEPISPVVLKNVSDITIQLNAMCSLTEHKPVGITICEATSVAVHLSSTNNCSCGFVLYNTINTHINKLTTMYSEFIGIATNVTVNTHISNTIVAHSNEIGMYLSTMSTTNITNMTTSHNYGDGVYSYNMSNTYMTNVTTSHNGRNGIYSYKMSNTFIANLTTIHSGWHGMKLLMMSNTHITNSTLAHNGQHGMLLSDMNDTHITNMTTEHNSGGGMKLVGMRNTHMTNTTAKHNDIDGMGFRDMRNTYMTNSTSTHNDRAGIVITNSNNTLMTKVTAKYNRNNMYFTPTGDFGGQIVLEHSLTTLIYNTSFTAIDVAAQNTFTTEDPESLPAVFVMYQSELLISGCDFTRNSISAIRAYLSYISLSGDLTFSNNTAFAGTAFILIKQSVIYVVENSHTSFINNRAINNGGVFYITSNDMYLTQFFPFFYSKSTCFFNIEGSRFQTVFTFANNSAGKGGDILYGGHVAFGFIGDWNCLDNFKDISNISQSGLSLISSDPSRVCFCDERGQPDCLVIVDPIPRTVYPGQTINISLVVVGQDFGTVAGSAYAQFLLTGSPPQLEPGQEVQSVTQHNCNNLYYTIFSQSEGSETMLVLTAQNSYVSKFLNKKVDDHILHLKKEYYRVRTIEPLVYSSNPVYVNVSLLPCPPGFMLTTDPLIKCDCNALLQQMDGIQCHIQEQTIRRGGLLWVGMIQDDNGTNGTVAASKYCPLDYCNEEEINVTLSEPDSQCSYSHSGTLCGGCQPGLSLTLGSAQCLPCSNKYLALLIPLTLAGPVLVFFIKLLDLTISQGTLNGLLFYVNVIKANEYIFFPRRQTNLLTVFVAWLNLDLGVETCLSHGLTAYSKAWLQFVFPFYIWSIAGFIIILAKYSDRVAKVMGNNSVPVLATLFLLSYAKLFRTIITALSYTVVYTSHGSKAVWAADGNVDYLGPQHVPLFAISVAVLLFLWLPYTLLLFLGQWLQRCNCRLIVRMLLRIKPFLDAHYGCSKNKHCYWFGALLLVRAAILLISALVPADRSSIIVLCALVSAVALAYFGQLVSRNIAVAMFDIAFFMNLVLMAGAYFFITTAGGDLAVSTDMLVGVAFLQFVGLVFFKVFCILKQNEKVMRCFHHRQPVEDDWELYEQAALLREMISDAEEQESEGSGSTESLPTY